MQMVPISGGFGHEGIDYVPAKTPFQGETGVSVAREPNGTIVLAAGAIWAASLCLGPQASLARRWLRSPHLAG